MTDKNDLLQAATRILQLLPDDGYIDLNEESELMAVKANAVGSHYVVLGEIPNSDLDVEVWLECNTGWPPPNFWYGIGSSLYNSILTVANFGKSKYRDHGKFLIYAQEKKVPLRREGFGHPVLEGKKPSKRHSEYYYGIYLEKFPPVDSSIMKDAAKFSYQMAVGFAEEYGRQLSAIEGMEGHKKYGWHRVTERDSKLAKAAKAKACYKCGVCGFIFEKRYGRLGKKFAEAHHKIPVSKLRGITKVTVDDLLCVCSNCHRMLHRVIRESKKDGQAAIDTLVRSLREQ